MFTCETLELDEDFLAENPREGQSIPHKQAWVGGRGQGIRCVDSLLLYQGRDQANGCPHLDRGINIIKLHHNIILSIAGSFLIKMNPYNKCV